MSSKILRILILGAPASGKGTISSRIINHFPIIHVSSGDILRRNINDNTPLGFKAKDYISRGQLVPDNIITDVILDELKELQNVNWLLDGFPRTKPQAEKLWSHCKLDLAINLDVPFEIIVKRVEGRWVHLPSGRVYNTDFNAPKVFAKDDITGEDLIQRDDDKPDAVLKRLKIYENSTKPVIDFYREKGILKEFSGKTSDEIWPKVQKCVSEHLHN